MAARALYADGAFVSGGLAGGALIGLDAVPFVGARAAEGWAFDRGLELGAEAGASGMIGEQGALLLPLAVTAAWRFPLGERFSAAGGAAAGGALVLGNATGAELFAGPRLDLELHIPALPGWSAYIAAGADFFFERTRTVSAPFAGAGVRKTLGRELWDRRRKRQEAAQQTKAVTEWTVQEGDSLTSIALRVYGDPRKWELIYRKTGTGFPSRTIPII